MKSLIKNEKGATLIFTLVVFVFVSIIATAVISVATNEKIHSIDKNKEIQATYVAYSGIELLTEYMDQYYEDFSEKLPTDASITSVNNFISKDFNDIDADLEGNFEVSLDNITENGFLMVSEGTYRDKTISIKREFEKIDITHDFMFGEFYIDTDDYPNYKPVEIPTEDVETYDNGSGGSSLKLTNNEKKIIEFSHKTTRFSEISVPEKAELTFKLANSATDLDSINIIVEKLDIKGAFNLDEHPSFRVYLYVENSGASTGIATFKTSFGNDPNNFIIMLDEGSELVVLNNDDTEQFNAYVYGPKATVDIYNAFNFNGAVIASDLRNPANKVDKVYVRPTKILDLESYISYQPVYKYIPVMYQK